MLSPGHPPGAPYRRCWPHVQVPQTPAELKEWAENTALGTLAGMLYCGGRQFLANRREGVRTSAFCCSCRQAFSTCLACRVQELTVRWALHHAWAAHADVSQAVTPLGAYRHVCAAPGGPVRAAGGALDCRGEHAQAAPPGQ